MTTTHELDGTFKFARNGERVFQIDESDVAAISVGDTVQYMDDEWEPEGEAVTVYGIGRPFSVLRGKRTYTYRYLYLEPRNPEITIGHVPAIGQTEDLDENERQYVAEQMRSAIEGD